MSLKSEVVGGNGGFGLGSGGDSSEGKGRGRGSRRTEKWGFTVTV